MSKNDKDNKVVCITKGRTLFNRLKPLFNRIVGHYYSNIGLTEYKKLNRQYCGEYFREIRRFKNKSLSEVSLTLSKRRFAISHTYVGVYLTSEVLEKFENNCLDLPEYKGEGGLLFAGFPSIRSMGLTQEISEIYNLESHWWRFKELSDGIYSTTQACAEHRRELDNIYGFNRETPMLEVIKNESQ